MPLSSPACYFKGFIKAAFARFFIPFYALLAIVICSIWGLKVLPDVIIALLAIYLFTIVFYYYQNANFPFGMEKIATQGGAAFLKVMGLILVAALLGFSHYFLLKWFSFANLLLIPVYLLAIYYVNRIFVYKKITWERVDSVNSYS